MGAKTPVQLTLDSARKARGRGGWRPGAGRKKGRATVSHAAREDCSRHVPCHVTLRIVDGVSLRRDFLMTSIRRAIAASHRTDFSIAHFNVLTNHIHLIVEADSKSALATGIQGLEVRLAIILNRKLRRTGKLFVERYHARALRTPREVRNALRYVLNNARHHAAEAGKQLRAVWFDPYSSAAWFDGWATPLPQHADWQRELVAMPPPVARPRSWLLASGWRKHGALALDEIPGGSRRKVTTPRR